MTHVYPKSTENSLPQFFRMVSSCLALLLSTVLIGVGAGPVKAPFSLNRSVSLASYNQVSY
jgi:hypothetical protein